MIDSGLKNSVLCLIWTSLWFAPIPEVSAAGYEFIAIENVFIDAAETIAVQARAIVVTSSRQRFESLPRNTRNALQKNFVYQTRVKVKGGIYYRLALGNFSTAGDAKAALQKLKPNFPDAWIYKRTNPERQALSVYLKTRSRKKPADPVEPQSNPADELLARGKQEFLDGNYARVLAIADKVVSIGSLEQVRAALELAGTTRERQGKFTRAEGLYESLLDTDPPPALSARILSRLEGIRTMRIEPKARLADGSDKSEAGNWIFRGALHQYFRDDVIDRPDEDSEEVNQALVTDVDLQVRRKTDADTMTINFDAGLVLDFIEDQTDSRVSRANFSYARDDFRIVGGRQFRTVTGVYGRFDGFTYSDLSRSEYQISYFLGALAQSSSDSLETDNSVVGANLDFRPYDWLDVNLYLVSQEVSELTDRRAIGSEFQLQNNLGFVYGIIDYDVFYEDLNNITFVSNYRYDPRWNFNLTLGRANAPTLSTANALQGQVAASIDELGETFGSDEIYRLAQDRTSKSDTLYFGVIYSFEDNRQLNVDFSVFNLDATETSAGVDAIPSTRDVLVSVDYSVSNFFSNNDYTSLGFRLSDSDTSEIQSFRLRSRFRGPRGLIYDPRVQLDLRQSPVTGIDQTILKPAIKLRYPATKNLNFETDFGIEYSDLDLPDFDRQIAYSLYLGYTYFF